MNAELIRLEAAREHKLPWKKWAPYLCERQSDYLLFCEYFHGNNGAGLGASHQTAWSGIIARIIHLFTTTTAELALELGKAAAVRKIEGSGKLHGAVVPHGV